MDVHHFAHNGEANIFPDESPLSNQLNVLASRRLNLRKRGLLLQGGIQHWATGIVQATD